MSTTPLPPDFTRACASLRDRLTLVARRVAQHDLLPDGPHKDEAQRRSNRALVHACRAAAAEMRKWKDINVSADRLPAVGWAAEQVELLVAAADFGENNLAGRQNDEGTIDRLQAAAWLVASVLEGERCGGADAAGDESEGGRGNG